MDTIHIGLSFSTLTQLDLTGPLEVLRRLPGAKTHIVAKTLAPVESDCGLSLVPTEKFDDCPQLDLICVPGGMGVPDTVGDAATVGFVRGQAAGAKYVTSVCTGAFILGVAGLLEWQAGDARMGVYGSAAAGRGDPRAGPRRRATATSLPVAA